MNDKTRLILEVAVMLLLFGGGIVGGLMIKAADTTRDCNEYWINYTNYHCFCSAIEKDTLSDTTPVWSPNITGVPE
jgi:hypothetical protein